MSTRAGRAILKSRRLKGRHPSHRLRATCACPDGRKDHQSRCIRQAAALSGAGLQRPVRALFVPAPETVRAYSAGGIRNLAGSAEGPSSGILSVAAPAKWCGRKRRPCPGTYLVRLGPAAARWLQPSSGPTCPSRCGGGTGGGDGMNGTDGRLSRPARLAVVLVTAYQGAASGRISPCRFYPSCSNYAVEALTVHGFWRGLALTADGWSLPALRAPWRRPRPGQGARPWRVGPC